MFGRKKKDEKEGDTTEDVSTSASGSTAIAPAMSTPIQAPSVPAGSPTPTNFPPLSATSSYQPPRGPPPSTQVDGARQAKYGPATTPASCSLHEAS